MFSSSRESSFLMTSCNVSCSWRQKNINTRCQLPYSLRPLVPGLCDRKLLVLHGSHLGKSRVSSPEFSLCCLNSLFSPPTPLPGLPRGLSAKESTWQCGRCRFNPWVGKFPRNGDPLQYSCLGNPLGRGDWRATVNKSVQSWTWLSTHTQPPSCTPATHSPLWRN